ncbi:MULTISPECIES: hypothetical protein [Methylococcus]|uniref:Uncharacterized protein n=1 Tax=Methylococcus capsulatus TaxID=414 RepID=A0ABZ2F9N9_METCP|nr:MULTISPECIES: hypothetical protein [Methylococcus]MDF9392878.1 hypothetical protein [Methylococcus capsulatus]
MLDWIAFLLVLALIAIKPWVLAIVVPLALLFWWHLRISPPPAEKSPEPETRTADGRFALLNKDWVGEVVNAIDDPEIPEIIRRHGARFRNPARYVIVWRRWRAVGFVSSQVKTRPS